MTSIQWESIEAGRVLRFRAGDLTWRDAVRCWQEDDAFCEAFVASASSAPFEAFFWETPPVSPTALGEPFEWVLVDSPALAGVRADPEPFRDRIEGERGVKTFANLGGDAELVVPCAGAGPEHYPHLAAFVRGAPGGQVRELLRAVGAAVERRLDRSSEPCWVSTSGLGVYWIHVRLDSRPKYYTWAPYRIAP